MIKAIIFDLDGTLLNREDPENDVRAAQNVGIKGIRKKDFQWNHVEADFIVGDLAQLPLIIGKLSKQNI